MIGLFVIFSVVLFMTAIVIFGGNKFFAKENLMISYFEGSLKGLSVGADVTYRGVSIGQVKEIKIHIRSDSSSNKQKILIPVLISLNAGKTLIVDGTDSSDQSDIKHFMQELCDQGLRAKLKLKSLVTGKLYVDLAFYENSAAIYRDTEGKYFEIPTLPSEMQQFSKMMENGNIGELFQKFMSTLDAIEQLSTGLATTLDQQKTEQLMNNLLSSTNTFKTILSQVENDLPPLLQKMDNGLDQFASFGKHADQTVLSIDKKIKPLATDLSKTLANIDNSLQKADTLLVQAEKTLQPDSPMYTQFTTAMAQLKTTARSVQRLSDFVHRNPNTLIFGLQQADK